MDLSALRIDFAFIGNAAFWAALLAGLCMLTLSLLTLGVKSVQFWPPRKGKPGRRLLFLLLFRSLIYGLIILTITGILIQPGRPDGAAFWVGIALMLAGFGTAFYTTYAMGWKNAFGKADGLRTDGLFRFSRNPVYVSSWLGMLGWGLFADMPRVWILLSLWAALYVIAPFLEEPWLEKRYGADYLDYRFKTRRFL